MYVVELYKGVYYKRYGRTINIMNCTRFLFAWRAEKVVKKYGGKVYKW